MNERQERKRGSEADGGERGGPELPFAARGERGSGGRLGTALRNPAELLDEVVHGLPAVVRVLGEAAADGAVERGRRRSLEGGNGRRLVLHNGGDEAGLAAAFEGFAAGHHFEEQDAE